MTSAKLFLLIFCTQVLIKYLQAIDNNYVLQFFRSKNLRFASGFLCDENEVVQLSKKLSTDGVRSNFPVLRGIKTSDEMAYVLYHPTKQMIGVMIDMNCKESQAVLQIASSNRFFDLTRHWLIFVPEHFQIKEFENISKQLQPQLFDLYQYLESGNDQMEHGERMRELNMEINDDILNDPKVNVMMVQKPKNLTDNISIKLSPYVNLQASVDSEVILVVPAQNESRYELYEIHRKTYFTRMLIERSEITDNNDAISSTELVPRQGSAVRRRKNFQGAIMRGTSALLHIQYFSKSGEVTNKRFDYWGMLSLQISILAEAQYNFRLLVKCFDDYGWPTNNGSFTGMLGHLAEHKADMTSSGMILLTRRLAAVSYVDNAWNNRMGLIFKQPPLSQVTNIFVLPFSNSVWLSFFCLCIVSGFILYYQFKTNNKVEEREESREILQIFSFLAGATFQQGTELTPKSIATRATMLVFSVSTLFLFTSYTANIVALLQSPSNTINSVKDFVDSSLDMGIENLPYQVRLIEDDNDTLIKELFRKKLSPKITKGLAYVNSTVGMEKVRQGLYAFHVQLPIGARIISDTYTASDKSRLKTIELFPKRFYGHAVPKNSPYFEILAQAHRWYAEVGFVQRTDKRFSYELPSGEAKGSGYNSIGVVDIRNIFLMFSYGIAISFVILLIEKMHYISKSRSSPWNRIRLKQVKKKFKPPKMKKQTIQRLPRYNP